MTVISPFTQYNVLAFILSRFDRVLTLGVFNIQVHICCPSACCPSMDFIDVVHSLNLTQSVEGPTHLMGHTLDIVLSSGLILNCVVLPPPAPSVTSYIPSRALMETLLTNFIRSSVLLHPCLYFLVVRLL